MRRPRLRAKLLGDERPGYDARDLEQRFGVSAAVVRTLLRAGHIQPASDAEGLTLSFQDLVILRTASALRAAKIPARAINRALRKIRSTLPEGSPLSAQSIAVLGNRIALRDGQSVWESDSGQYALALETSASESARIDVLHTNSQPQASELAEAQFACAYALEEEDPVAAVAAYQTVLAVDPTHNEARVNLGRLLHLQGRHLDAETTYRAGATHPLLLFNLAVLLEDLQRIAEAIATYRETLALDPSLIDAHFNLARLYEIGGDQRAALRHLLAYRRSKQD